MRLDHLLSKEKSKEEGIEWCKSLGRILGARQISVLSPEEHDEMIGFVSQLTHCIAVELLRGTKTIEKIPVAQILRCASAFSSSRRQCSRSST